MSTLDRQAVSFEDVLAGPARRETGRHVRQRPDRSRLQYALGALLGLTLATALGFGAFFAARAVLAPAPADRPAVTSVPVDVLGA